MCIVTIYDWICIIIGKNLQFVHCENGVNDPTVNVLSVKSRVMQLIRSWCSFLSRYINIRWSWVTWFAFSVVFSVYQWVNSVNCKLSKFIQKITFMWALHAYLFRRFEQRVSVLSLIGKFTIVVVAQSCQHACITAVIDCTRNQNKRCFRNMNQNTINLIANVPWF